MLEWEVAVNHCSAWHRAQSLDNSTGIAILSVGENSRMVYLTNRSALKSLNVRHISISATANALVKSA